MRLLLLPSALPRPSALEAERQQPEPKPKPQKKNL
jgi:hypothetical protein